MREGGREGALLEGPSRSVGRSVGLASAGFASCYVGRKEGGMWDFEERSKERLDGLARTTDWPRGHGCGVLENESPSSVHLSTLKMEQEER